MSCSAAARTFWTAYQRAKTRSGALVYRNEDLDPQRSRKEFVAAAIEDLRWLGIEWQEGPDVGGPFGPYSQSERRAGYVAAWRRLDWSSDPLACGGYTFLRPGGVGARERLAAADTGALFWAGSETATQPIAATVAGAYVSGLRAAREVLAELETQKRATRC